MIIEKTPYPILNSKYLDKYLLILILFYLSFLFLVTDYGQSFDVFINNINGKKAIEFYRDFDSEKYLGHAPHDQLYGPILDVISVLFQSYTDNPINQHLIRTSLHWAISGSIIFPVYFLLRNFMNGSAAVISTLFIVLTPSYLGHAFMNPKDAPFASIYVWLLYAIVSGVQSNRISILNSMIIGFLIGFATSIRVSAVLIVPVYVFLFYSRYGWRYFIGYASFVAIVTSVFSYIALMPYILARQSPWALVEVVQKFSKFDWVGPVLYFGNYHFSTDLPWHYVIGMLYAKLPEIYFAAMIASVAAFLFANRDFFLTNKGLLIAIGLSWAIPILSMVLMRPVLYDGLRQFLFVVPCIGLSLAAGAAALYARLTSSLRVVMVGVVLVCGASQLRSLIGLHPYEYIYTNQLVARNQFESDYWGLSFKEIALYINAHVSEKDINNKPPTIFVSGPSHSLDRFLIRRHRIVWSTKDLTAGENILVVQYNRSSYYEMFNYGTKLLEIKRDGVSLSRLLRIERYQPD